MPLIHSVYALLLVLLCCWLVWNRAFFNVSGVSKRIIVLAFLAKVFAGLGITAVYTFYYTDVQNADIYKYFNDGVVLKNFALQNPGCFLKLFFELVPSHECGITGMKYWDIPFTTGFYNDNRLLIKINALIAFISFNDVFIHAIIASFIGFFGLMLLIKTAALLDVEKTTRYAWMLLFFPSLLAWTSVVIKETVLLVVLGIFLYSLTHLFFQKRKPVLLVIALLSAVALAYVKVYVILCLVPCILAYAWSRNGSNAWAIIRRYSIVLVSGFILVALADQYLLKHRVWIRLAYKQYGMVKLAEHENAKSRIDISPLSLETYEKHTFFKAALGGFRNAFLRPNITDRGNPLMLIAGIENFFLLIFIALRLFWFRIAKPEKPNQLVFVIAFCIMILTITGITTPVIGSLVRFKVPYYCFILFL